MASHNQPKIAGSGRPLVTPGWPSTPPQRLIAQVAEALSGGPALAITPDGPAEQRGILLGMLAPDRPLESTEIAFVVPTSGSTGTPKGALLTAAAVEHSARATHAALGGQGQWLLALPPTQIAGLQVLVRSVLAATTPQIMDLRGGFTSSGFAAAAGGLAPGVRHYTALVPTQLDRLVTVGGTGLAAMARFDAVLVGGAPAAAGLLDAARRAGVRIIRTYGMTETGGGCVYDGEPLPGVRLEIDPDGLIRIGGPMLASGYRLRPDLSAERFGDGWFRTSDLGRIDAGGRLRVLGRADDVIMTGGVKVSAAAISALLGEHPAISAAAVVGVPDDHWGQVVVAAIAPRDPAHPPQLAHLRDFVKRRASPAMAPRELLILDELPTLSSGKVDLQAIRVAFRSRS